MEQIFANRVNVKVDGCGRTTTRCQGNAKFAPRACSQRAQRPQNAIFALVARRDGVGQAAQAGK
jgi:hypothetical protein